MHLAQGALRVWQAAVKAKVEPPTAAVPFGGEARKMRFAAPRHSTHTNSWEQNSILLLAFKICHVFVRWDAGFPKLLNQAANVRDSAGGELAVQFFAIQPNFEGTCAEDSSLCASIRCFERALSTHRTLTISMQFARR